jgi:chitodextrinase/predicted esterase
MKNFDTPAKAYAIAAIMSLFFAVAGNAQNCPPSNTMPEFEPFTYTPVQSWNTSQYESYQYNNPDPSSAPYMRFRMLSPVGFNRCVDDGQKYPLIVFLHGSGESGVYDATPNNGVGEQDNDKQLLHGGQKHLTAVNSSAFNGFVVFPQIRKTASNNYWGIDNLIAVRYIIDKLIADYRVDPDRIYMHGLSMGGEGTWIFLANFPKYLAAAHPMSAAKSGFWDNGTMQIYKHIPLWSAQGGLDSNPTKAQGNELIQQIRLNAGGNIRYSYYPNGGHSIWNNEYNKSDFFSWFLAQRKYNIWVENGQTSFCPGQSFSIKLGLTPGFDGYEWSHDQSTVISTANEITVTQADVGTYYARFRRGSEWTPWSAPVVIDNNKGPSPTPTITANGSVNLVPLDGSPEVTLSGPAAKALYTWAVTPSYTLSATQNITVSTAGSYSLQTKDAAATGFESDGETPTEYRGAPQGCISAASAAVVVTTSNGAGVPASPSNFFATTTTPNSVVLTWDDRSSNELGFEIYRSTTPGSAYKLITIRPASSTANPQSYTDNTVLANTIYYYRMRAVNSSGGSAYTPEISVSTTIDNVAPIAPVLSLVSASRTEINLSWTGATDNVAVYEYNVYQNGVLIATVPAATTTYKATGLVAFSTYNYVVRARDLATNMSPPSNQIVASAINSGLFYTYYHHNNDFTTVNDIVSKSAVIKTGYVSRFLLSPRTREDMFAFIFEGYINIPTTGSYTFYVSADDGAALYVNNVLVVNHDGTHSCTEKTGTPITLSAGSYPIKALYYEKTTGQCLTVKWAGPGITKVEIPDAAFKDATTPPASVAAPSNFTGTVISFSQINLSWTDNSNNETGFEISRSSSSTGTYQVIGVTAANAVAFSHTGLSPSSTHFYKIRAINGTNASSLVGPINKTTSTSPAAPTAPTGLAANAISATQVNLAWNDNSANEAGFEIQKSSSPTSGFVSVAIVNANVTSYSDTQVNGHSTIYYQVRSRGTGTSHSAYNGPVSVTTPNRTPTIQNIPDQSMTAASGSAQTLEIVVSDLDNDPIAFSFTTNGVAGLPAGGSFTDDGYGRAILTFTNVTAGTYNVIATGNDGLGSASDPFTLTFGSNTPPVATPTNPATFTNSLVTEEGRTTPLVFSVTDLEGNGTLVSPTITGLPAFGSSSWTGSGTAARTLTLTFSPGVGQAGIYNMSVDFKDASNGITTRTFSVTVLPVDNFYTVAINFVYSAGINAIPTYAESSPWNNTGSPSSTDISNLKDDTGNAIRFVTFNTGTGWNEGTYKVDLPFSATAPFTENVRESFYRKGGGSSLVTFKNLNPSLQYKFTIFGSGPSSGTATSTRYIVSGAGASQEFLLNTVNNPDQVAQTGFFYPKTDGSITIQPSRASGLSTGDVYINGLLMTAQYPAPEPPASPTGLTLSAPSYNTVNISWTDMSYNETSFQILRSNTVNGTYSIVATVPAEQTTATDTPVAGRTTYYYKVQAVNSFGTSAPTNALVITTPNGAPIVNDPGTITVRVGETIQHNISATDPEGDILTFATLNLPSFATLVDNGNGSGYIRLIPQNSDIGSHSFTLRATDNFSAQTEIGVTIIVLDAELDEAFFVNLRGTGTTSDAPAPWNNRTIGDGAALSNTSSQTASGVSISGASWTTAVNTGGVNTGNNSGVYPDKVMQSGWTTNSSASGATLSILGLNDNKRYNILLFGSINEYWFANTTYTINGVTKTLNTSKNKSNLARFIGLQPSGGIISITVKRGANVNASPVVTQRDGYLNALVIESYSEGTSPRKPTNLVAEAISKTDIKLSWFDNSSDETGFEIARATSQAGPFTVIHTTAANVDNYTNSGLVANTAYIYRVRAIKTTGSPSDYTNDALAATFNQIIKVNLNYSAAGGHQQASAPWNNTANVPIAGMSFDNLLNENSIATTVDLSIASQGSGSGNETGYVTGNNSGAYPDAVLANYYYFEQFEAPNQYLLSQLDPNYTYDLVFLGNEWTAATIGGVKVATDYIVGTTTISQFNGKNSTETVAVKGIVPEADNTISFSIKSNDEARYGVWNALEIRSYTPVTAIFDTEPPSVPQGLVASNITDTGFQVAWSPSTDNIAVASYEVFLGSDLVTTVADTFAIITNLQPSTTYSVTVRAVDSKLNRSGFSNVLQVTTLNSATQATVYYCVPSSDITLLASWGTNADGSGTNPASFALNNQHFMLTSSASVSAPWTIGGTNSKLIVDTTFTLTVNNTLSAIVDVLYNASVQCNASVPPTFGTLDPTSTITFTANPASIPSATYGNVILSGMNSTKEFSTGTYVINGDLQIHDGVLVNGSTGNNTILNIFGNVTLLGTPTTPAETQLLTLNLNSGETQTITASQNTIRLHRLVISDSTTVVVDGGSQKTISLGTPNGGGLTIEDGAFFNLGKNSLMIEGTGGINVLNQTGKLRVSQSSITMNSSSTSVSNLSFVTGYDTIKSLSMNSNPSGQLNIQTRMYVRELIELTNGRLNSNDHIVLISDAESTARVSKMGATALFLGKVEFQRYLDPKGKAYRYLSAPIYNSTVSQWDQSLPVTGPFTGSSNANTTNSLYYYDSDNGGWIPYPTSASTETMDIGRGYSIYIFSGTTARKLRVSGPIHQGNFTFNGLATDQTPETDEGDVEPGNGWNLLGNPYASPIQWRTAGWQTTGLNGSVYVRSNEVVGTSVVSTVRVWNGTLGDLPKGIINQGQSFWVKATGDDTPTLTVTEDAKYDTIRGALQRQATPENYIQISLTKGTLTDNAFIQFKTDGIDEIDERNDAYKLPNSFFNLSARKGSRNLAISTMSDAFCEKNVTLNVATSTAGQYKLAFNKLSSFNYDVQATLIDHFTQTQTLLTDGVSYTFDVTADPLSSGASRFELLIQKPAVDEAVTMNNVLNEVCGDVPLNIMLHQTQRGITYQLKNNSNMVKEVIGNGKDMTVIIPSESLLVGDNTFTLQAGFDGCTNINLGTSTQVNYIAKPVIEIQGTQLVASSAHHNQWLLDGVAINGATNDTFEPTVSGEYTVVTAGNTCEASSDPVLFAVTDVEAEGQRSIVLFPNPVRTQFMIVLPSNVREDDSVIIDVFNAQGIEVAHIKTSNNPEGIVVNTQDYSSGLYTLRVGTSQKQFEKRFIRE